MRLSSSISHACVHLKGTYFPRDETGGAPGAVGTTFATGSDTEADWSDAGVAATWTAIPRYPSTSAILMASAEAISPGLLPSWCISFA